MSLTHNLTFAWGAGVVSHTVAVTGQVEGGASVSVDAYGANDVELTWTDANLMSCYLVCDQAVTLTTNGTRQAETNTVNAAAGITSNGNAAAVVTAAGMTGSPLTVPVAVTTALTTAAAVAGAIRTALAANATIRTFFSVSGSGADVVLTALLPAANDGTMNLAIDDDTSQGITATASSTNTTAGVAVQDTFTLAANSPLVWYSGCGIANPFAGSVTKLTATNYGATAVTLTVKSLATT